MDPDSLGRAVCRDARVMVWRRRRRLANRVPQHRPVRDLEPGVHELTDLVLRSDRTASGRVRLCSEMVAESSAARPGRGKKLAVFGAVANRGECGVDLDR